MQKTNSVTSVLRKRHFFTVAGILMFALVGTVLLRELSAAPGDVQTTSTVSQYGVTWTFDSPRQVGQFANGDYWVVGPVTLTGITPDATGGRHGWEINPTTVSKHALDERAKGYDGSLLPSLPATVQPDSSIVKAVSDLNATPHSAYGCRPCLQTAAVLTVVGSPPADNGATVFRHRTLGATNHTIQQPLCKLN